MNNNISFIFQPHFKTMMFRPSCSDQRGTNYNYIVVTCSPSYNGVWKWDAKKKENYEIWNNKNRPCYCVPIADCVKIKELEEINNPEILNDIKRTQEAWMKFKSENK